jgi:hypothetical protein
MAPETFFHNGRSRLELQEVGAPRDGILVNTFEMRRLLFVGRSKILHLGTGIKSLACYSAL